MHFFAYKWISFRLLKFGIWQKRNVLHDWQVFDAFRKQRVVQWDIPLCVYTGLAFFRRLWTLPGRDSSLLLCPLKKISFFYSFDQKSVVNIHVCILISKEIHGQPLIHKRNRCTSGVEFCLHMKNVPGRVLSIKHAKRAPVKLALPRSVRKILSAFSFPENGK